MTENTAPVSDGNEFVSEQAPTQRRAGRPKGVKNGEGKTPAHKPAKLTADRVTIVNDVLMVGIVNGPTLRYNGDQRPTVDWGKGILSETEVTAAYNALKAAPDCPNKPEDVVKFLTGFGFGLTDYTLFGQVRNWIVK